jgi:glutathione peroxidase
MKTESAQTNLYDIPLNRIDGSKTSLADYSGKVLLIVNVASKCGLTPQYEGLEILGFPCNDFGEQEPGSESEIVSFCSTNYDVHFPLFSKVAVLGSDKHPLYKSLTEQKKDAIGEGPMREKLKKYGVQRENNADILWNFEKFLVDKHGKVVARFAPDVTADDERLLQAVQNELKA